ncbi:AraC family ligand binding domain-containing protein [Paenibacillus sp. PL2-23]|uniref:AraC family ligand binding domain-containing protein n=1 Tax=Paenibacillus sp. PL2-23 TaxID=2100729 RepID=UPI0030F834A8
MQHTVKFRTDRVPAVDNVGLFRTTALWAHMDRVLPHDVLIVVREGLVHIIEDGTEYHISPGEVFLMKRGVRHYGLPQTLPGSEWYWITFGAPETEEHDHQMAETETEAEAEIADAKGMSLLRGQLPQTIELKRLKVSDFQGICVRMNKLLHHYAMGTAYDRLKLIRLHGKRWRLCSIAPRPISTGFRPMGRPKRRQIWTKQQDGRKKRLPIC